MQRSTSLTTPTEHPPEKKESYKFLRIAHRFFPDVITFRRYIVELNAQTQDSNLKIRLQTGTLCSPSSFHRLVDRLYIAWPNQREFPRDVQQALMMKGTVSIDQLLQDVISTTLRRHSTGYAAERHNVLCNGFSIASDYGHPSVLRDLDARAPSTTVQILRSPGWRQILNCVGHVVLRHLLLNSVLLLSISEDTPTDNPRKAYAMSKILSSAFLQLCGPSFKECFAGKDAPPSKSPSSILFKTDLMYRTPTYRRVSQATSGSSDAQVAPNSTVTSWNTGLPKSHHLQGLSNDARSAKRLLSIVFSFDSGDETLSPSDISQGFLNGPRNSKKKIFGVSKTHTPHNEVDFDHRAKRIPVVSQSNHRGKVWLRSRNRSYKRLSDLVPVLRKVIRRTHKLSFRRVLSMICPLPKGFDRTTGSTQLTCEELINASSSPKDLARFVIACTRQMLPTAVFGSFTNRDIFERGVHNFLRRRLKRESFDISRFSAQSGIRVRDFEWLHRSGMNGKNICNPTDLKFRRSRIEDLCVWLFRGLVLPIIRQSFYVTDGDFHRNRMFFFRRELWVLLTDRAHRSVLRANKKFKILSKEELAQCIVKRGKNLALLGKCIYPHTAFLYHQLRFVPKRRSMRGIQRLKVKPPSAFSKAEGGNGSARRHTTSNSSNIVRVKYCMRRVFRHILRILAMESACDESKLGASLFSLNDVYERFLALKTKWRQKNRPRMYVCCVDISTSFDTVPLGTLLSDVLPKLLSKDRYVIFRYAIAKNNLATGRVSQRILFHACREPGEETSFPRIIQEQLCLKHSGAIFTDMVQVTSLTRAHIMLAIRELLGENIVSIPRRNRWGSETGFAQQYHGVPQGNELSTLLTSLFYGHVENEDLSEFLTSGLGDETQYDGGISGPSTSNSGEFSLLMRQVDDTIFLTSELLKALKFVKRTEKGWSNTHGFSVNAGKTKSNFSTLRGPTRRVQRLAWCGLIIDTESLEVFADYSRYGQKEGGRLRDTLFIEQDTRPGQIFAERAWTCFKPKLHPLLLDSRINSRFNTALNVYKAAVLVCLKLSSYAVVLLPRAVHLRNTAETVLFKFVDLVMRSVTSRWARTRSCCFALSRNEVIYLTIYAFRSGMIRKLRPRRKMKGRVTQCLGMIQRKLSCVRNVLQGLESSVEVVARRIDETLCGELWKIRL